MPRATRTLTDPDSAIKGGMFAHPMGHFSPNSLQSVLIHLARATFLHRGKLRHRMTHLIMRLGSPLDSHFRDCLYRIEGRNNLIEYGLLLHPSYNAPEINFLLEGLPEGGVAVDMGCNVGLYSLPLAKKAGSSGRVVSIDANDDMIQRVTFNAAGSGLSNVTALSTAVGDCEGSVDLHIRKDDVAIVNVELRADGKISIRPLRAILDDAGITNVDVLKIDIEGFEDKALVPYLDSSPEAMLPTRIAIEHPAPDADYEGCAAAFARHGYQLQGRTRSNSLYLRATG